MQILLGRAGHGALSPAVMDGMHALRYGVFRERLHWEIPVAEDRERDGFDDCNPVFVLARQSDAVVGCCRLLPTTGPYMLKDTFPQLLGDQPAPAAEDVWEISRFAVAKAARPGFGFSAIPATMIRELVRYALDHRIRRYVFVTTTAFERLLRRLQVHLDRLAPPMQIGVEKSVALCMYIDAATIRAAGADVGTRSLGRPQRRAREAA